MIIINLLGLGYIAIVRRSIWSNKYCSKSENQLDLDKCSEEKINSLIYQLTLAA